MASNPVITAADAADMVRHRLTCPVYGYLGQDYGTLVHEILHTPMGAGIADAEIEKCRADIPLLASAPAGAVNLYAYDADIDRKVIVYEVAGQLVPVPGGTS